MLIGFVQSALAFRSARLRAAFDGVYLPTQYGMLSSANKHPSDFQVTNCSNVARCSVPRSFWHRLIVFTYYLHFRSSFCGIKQVCLKNCVPTPACNKRVVEYHLLNLITTKRKVLCFPYPVAFFELYIFVHRYKKFAVAKKRHWSIAIAPTHLVQLERKPKHCFCKPS